MGKKVGRKILSFIISFCMLLVGMPVFAGTVTLSSSDNGKVIVVDTYGDGTLKIPSSITDITLEGTTVINNLNIEVEERSTNLNLTIKNLQLQDGKIDFSSAKTTVGNTLYLEGDSIINNSKGPAVQIEGNNNLLIIKASDKDKNGSLKATGGANGAGIGAKADGDNGGRIIIESGVIEAQGASAGIGAGKGREFQDIEIKSLANVKATGGANSAGIGSGEGAVGNILIDGATVTAIGGNGGAGIGAGVKACGNITITGGAYIYAEGNGGGAGIGGGKGSEAKVKDILIDGATIEAYGSNDGGAGIGGGNASKFDNLIIQESNADIPTVIKTAKGGNLAAGIGVGSISDVSGMAIKILGGTISKATGGNQGAGIGGGSQCSVDITISGGVIESAQGGSQAAGIGSGPIGSHKEITISGGLIKEAIGGEYGAGIGGGDTRSEKVTITAGIIEKAQGGKDAAGIGGGRAGKDNQPISITGGKVYAVAGEPSNPDKGPVNDIGSGRCDVVTDEANDKVTIKDADVFVDGNTIRGITPESTAKEVIFTLYDDWSASQLCTQNKVYLRAIDNETNKNLIMDGKYDVKTGSKVYARIELGSVTSTNIKVEEVFHKYWFQYDTAAGIPMVGHPITTSSGWTFKGEIGAAYTTTEGDIVCDINKLDGIEMDIEFKPGSVSDSGVGLTGFDDDISGITPFSTSCITFEIPKITHANFKKLEKVEVVMDLTGVDAITTGLPIAMDASKWQVGVFEKIGATTKYDYKEGLTQDLKDKVTVSGKKITLEYPSNILEDGKYKIAVYVPTEYFIAAAKPDLKNYKANYVDAKLKLAIPMAFDIDMKVLTTQNLTIPGIDTPIEVKNVTVTENEHGNTSLNIPYKEITKIS